MVKWGILGAGNIAARFIESLFHSQEGELYAVASFTEEKRNYYKEKFPEIQVYKDYFELLDDPQVDAIYIATRHKDHYRWAKEALIRKKLFFVKNQQLYLIKKQKNYVIYQNKIKHFLWKL